MTNAGLIALILFFSFLLIKSADLIVLSLKRISSKTRTGVFALSAIIMALGTSFPEISVGITSALQEVSNLSLGVVIGSNIANIAFVAGLAGLSAGKVHIRGDFIKRDVWIALVTGLAPLIFVMDGAISRSDGLILIGIYILYASSLFRGRFVEVGKAQEQDKMVYRFLRIFNHLNKRALPDMLRLTIGVAGLLLTANIIVWAAKLLAENVGIPVFVVGLVIIAIGTSLPELAFSFRSLRDHSTGMFFGNILGSTIVNSTLIVGVTSIIRPVVIVSFDQYSIAAITFILASLSFWFFTRTKRRLDWWESLSLLGLYVLFVLLEFM